MTSQAREAARSAVCGQVYTVPSSSGVKRRFCGRTPHHWGVHGEPIPLEPGDLPEKTSDKLLQDLREILFLETQGEAQRLLREAEGLRRDETAAKIIAQRQLEAQALDLRRKDSKIEQLQRRLREKVDPQLKDFSLDQLLAEISRRAS